MTLAHARGHWLMAVLLVVGGVVPAAAQTVEPRHAIAMHGQPKYAPGFKYFDYVNPRAPKGGRVKLGELQTFDTLNPFNAKGDAGAGAGAIYDTLMVTAADEAFTKYGLLAETVEMPDDRSWIIFNLRPQARWHDGKPITADDVIFTFQTLTTKGHPFYRFYYKDVKKAEKLDPHRVKFTFGVSENRELPLIVGEMAILPKHYWQGRDFTRTTLEPPLGSGAYRIGKLEAGRFIELERVPDYWGKDLPVNVGQDNFDLLRYDYYRDATLVVEAFKSGKFDYRNENSSKTWATAYDMDEVKTGQLIKLKSPHNRSAGMQGFAFNTRRPLFKDRRLREALGYAFDFEWSNKNLFYGQYKRTRSYFDNSELAATGLPTGAELAILEKYRGRVPDAVFSREYKPPVTDGMGRIRANLRAADELLKAAGWVIKDGQRINSETGQALEFELLLVSPLFERIALPFAKNLSRLGVKARVRLVDSSQYVERLRTFDFDMITAVWGQSLSPGNEQRSYWTTTAADQRASRNLAGIKDAVVDELVDAVIAAPDRESLVVRTRALDRVLAWGFYVVPQFHLDYDRLVFWNRFGRPKVVPTQGSQFGTWWIDPALDAALKAARKRG